MSKKKQILRAHIEDTYARELKWLKDKDDKPKPPNWQLSPWAVKLFVLGGKLDKEKTIVPKYFGQERLIEISIATLATDRALLLLGVPGTGKTMLGEHLCAAISGDSSLLIQGTAGLGEEALRYNWNYARLIAEGPSRESLVSSPVMEAMENGQIVRIEELTRLSSDVQDTLITILSEKVLPIPELGEEVLASKGFNLIATANNRDQGVNELSSALRRRFNTVVLPLPATLKEEVDIVSHRVSQLGDMLDMPEMPAPVEQIKRLVQIFRELRSGRTEDGESKLKRPSATLSTAEAISVMNNSQSLAIHFGKGEVSADELAAGLNGAIIQDPENDARVWEEYLETVVKQREGWDDIYRACKGLLG